MTSCEVCGERLPPGSRADRRYCSPRCKVRAWRRGQRPRLQLVVDGNLAEEVELDLDEEERLQAGLVGSIIEASRHDWRAAAWLLQRRWPERYARP
jgi:hypothetical protein